MSDRALAAIQQLQKKAQAGDQRAQVELGKLVMALRQRRAANQAVLGAALEARRQQVEEQEVFGGDELDDADFINLKMENADDLTRKVALRGKAWKGLEQAAPFARVNPPSVLQGVIGGQQVCTVGGPAITVANWGGPDAETLPVTCTFGPVMAVDETSVADGGRLEPIKPLGVVQWGTRGAMLNATVDIERGCQFTVNASQVNLQVMLEVTGFTPGVTAKLAGMLSFYPCLRTTPLTRSFQHGSTNINVPFLFNVPNFARQLVLGIGNPLSTYTIDFLDSTGTTIYTYSLAAGQIMQPVNIPNGTEQVAITRTNAQASISNYLTFLLSL